MPVLESERLGFSFQLSSCVMGTNDVGSLSFRRHIYKRGSCLSSGMWLPPSTGEAHQFVQPGDSGLVMLEGAMGWTWTLIPALSPPSGWKPACSEFSTGRVRLLSKISCHNHFQKLCKTTISRS